MTILVGVLCSDGVVIAADSALTMGQGPALGQLTISHQARKIDIISNQIIVATAGPVGLGQRFVAKVGELWTSSRLKGSEIEIGRLIAKEVLHDFATTGLKPPYNFGALVAFPKSQEMHLCEFQVTDMQPEFKTKKIWFVSMGSGKTLADPYLALMSFVFWSGGPPTVEDGKFAAVWVVQHVLRAAPGLVGPPIDVAVLKKDANGIRATLLSDDDLQEHLAYVEDADRHFGSWRPTKVTAEDIPEPRPRRGR